jgi:hypothetical protein
MCNESKSHGFTIHPKQPRLPKGAEEPAPPTPEPEVQEPVVEVKAETVEDKRAAAIAAIERANKGGANAPVVPTAEKVEAPAAKAASKTNRRK